MGDYIDAVGYKDPRFNPRDIDPETRVADLDDLWAWQAKAFMRLVEPIKSRCLGLICGNHEESIRLNRQTDPARSIAEWMGVPDLRYAATIRIGVYERDSRSAYYSVIVYAHHGFGGGRTKGGKVNKVTRDVDDIAPSNADIILFGHVHDETPAKKVWIRVSERGELCLVPGERVGLLTGSFRKNWVRGTTTYNEKKGMPMVCIGAPHVIIWQERDLCQGVRDRCVEHTIVRFRTVGS